MTPSKLAPGDVVLIRFPFTNLEQTKKRPGLVLSVTEASRSSELVTISMITSKLDGIDLEGDVIMKDWKEAKLLHPSLIRLSKIATLEGELIERKLGRITLNDKKEVQKNFRKLFLAWLSAT